MIKTINSSKLKNMTNIVVIIKSINEHWINIICEKVLKKSEPPSPPPQSLLPWDFTGNALFTAQAWGLVCLRPGRVSAPSPDLPLWAQPLPYLWLASGQLPLLLGSFVLLRWKCFPSKLPPLAQRPGGSGFCFLSDTLPCGLLQMNPVEDTDTREY